MRVLQSRYFSRFARKSGIQRVDLLDAVERATSGLIDADLGGGLVKQRVDRAGGGRSGGFRTVLVFRSGDRAVFVYGFAKNVQANLSPDDLRELRFLAKRILGFSSAELDTAVRQGDFLEVSREP